MRVFEGEFELLILSLFQRVQEVLGEPSQLLSHEGQEGRICCIQILIVVNAQERQLLLHVFDFSLNFLRQVEPIPLAKLDQSVQVPPCLGPPRALLNFFLQP